MQNLFQAVAIRKPKRNKFDLSHEKKLTMHMGKLVPIMCQEVLPGDTFNCNTELLIRLTPLQTPAYVRVKAYTHFFFVPTRILWDEFKDFITGGPNGTSAPVHPYFLFDETQRAWLVKGQLADYLGIPPVDLAPPLGPIGVITNPLKVSCLPFRAYLNIYNEYYRDQNLITEVPFSKGSGNMTLVTDQLANMMWLRQRAWKKDYFTSALPFAQRGPAVGLPITMNYAPTSIVKYTDGSTPSSERDLAAKAGGNLGEIGTGLGMRIENLSSTAVSTTINDLRVATRLQEWLERNARGGARYIEQILHHFGITSSDARLQRPEYLGGGQAPIVISEVLSSFQDPAGAGDPQGSMAGHGIGVTAGHGFGRKTFEEHGYIMGILSVIPDVAYSQGLEKHWQRFDKLDYAWPSFGQLGEQPVKNRELYVNYTGTAGIDDGTFGYQSRYAEYKYKCGSFHGDFRDNLSYWHQDQIFTAPPALNESFISSIPNKRIFAVTDPTIHPLYVQLYHNLNAIRPLPYFGTPTL